MVSDSGPRCCAASVTVSWRDAGGQDRHGELDLAVLDHERLLVVECKTSSSVFHRQRRYERALARLDRWRSQDGSGADSVLLSARWIGPDLRDDIRARGVECFDNTQLAVFQAFVRKWAASPERAAA
ncbi:hypothetical protein [Solimonas variicoloris]|uniref:hypothetical protein n=1 Tax=Solimonas variicoloris TaxID=254408 RepID=UPI00035ECDEE|nr:hypothetical protein [Solimonas variicoloris]